MNEWLKRLLEQLKALWGKWSVTQKVVLFGVVGAVILGIVLVVAFASAPSYAPILGRPITDPTYQARILEALDKAGIAYTVRNNTIYAADARTALRAKAVLMQEDLVSADINPWEFFTGVSRWSVTDFERNVNLRQALTKQMELNIQSLEGIDVAKVMLDIPEERLLKEDQKPITASVIITPSPGSEVTTNKKLVQGIERIVMKGVSGLTHENTVITDNQGNVLNDFEGMAAFDTVALRDKVLKQKRTLEKQYEDRIMQALSRIWPNRVQVIKFEIDLGTDKTTTQTKEHFPITLKARTPGLPYDDSQVVISTPISEQQSQVSFEGTGFTPQGPAGQEGQTPPAYKDLSNTNGSYKEDSLTRNYAVNERDIQVEGAVYKINRVTAAVALDGVWKWKYDAKGKVILKPDGSIDREYVPVTDEELRSAIKLVQDAVGFDRGRGDSVSVSHLQFDHSTEQDAENSQFRRQIQLRRTVIIVALGILGLLVAAVLYRVLAKEAERRRRLREEELARQHQAMREAALRSAEEQGVEVELSVEDRARLEMQENAVNMAREHPEDVAQLIRTWLMEE
jgi:flagellar M-ring protein FliF